MVARIPLQHFILRNQPLGTFREKDFVAELHRGEHLAAFDQIGVSFKRWNRSFSALGTCSPWSTRRRRLSDHRVSQVHSSERFPYEVRDGQVGNQILAARCPRLACNTFRALFTTSSVIPMSWRYFSVCRSCRSLGVNRWISCIRRRAARVRLRNPEYAAAGPRRGSRLSA